MRNLIFAAIVALVVYVSGNAQVRPVGDDESKKAQAAAPASWTSGTRAECMDTAKRSRAS
jgi:hypothetical protein